MGVTAGFTLITQEQYALVRSERNAIIEPEPRVHFDLDKSWSFFDAVFKGFGPPLSQVFEGDYLPDGLWEGGTHFGYISPELALAVGTALVYVEPEHIFARAAEMGLVLEPERERMYRDFFFELKIAFRVAVRSGGALLVCIC